MKTTNVNEYDIKILKITDEYDENKSENYQKFVGYEYGVEIIENETINIQNTVEVKVKNCKFKKGDIIPARSCKVSEWSNQNNKVYFTIQSNYLSKK